METAHQVRVRLEGQRGVDAWTVSRSVDLALSEDEFAN